jgi:hypothetical protein
MIHTEDTLRLNILSAGNNMNRAIMSHKLTFSRMDCTGLIHGLQKFYQELMDEQFYSSLTGLISYLRRQQNLIAEMKTQAPKVADTHWEFMSKVSNWFKVDRI